jgi:hypothetical protein
LESLIHFWAELWPKLWLIAKFGIPAMIVTYAFIFWHMLFIEPRSTPWTEFKERRAEAKKNSKKK